MSIKLTYEFVKEQIENTGYELLSKEYKNNYTKLKVKCNRGHEYETPYGRFKQGHRCPICFNKRRYKNRKLTYEFIKEQIEKEGYELLSTEYKNCQIKIKVKCDKGHEYKVRYNNFRQGQRCPICFNIKKGKIKKHSYEYVKEHIEKEGYELLSNRYVNAHSKIKLRCNKGHEYEVRWYDFQQVHRCPICAGKQSKSEKEIAEYIKSLGLDIIENDRKQIINPLTNYPLEIDIFIPEYNKAIEFNGKHWHSKHDVKIRDEIKKQECINNGIDLLIIDEEEWLDNEEECLNKIRNFIE